MAPSNIKDALLAMNPTTDNYASPNRKITSAELLTDSVGRRGPIIESISPSSTAELTSTVVTITGIHMSTVTHVFFGNVAAKQLQHLSDTQIVCLCPALNASTVDVTLLGRDNSGVSRQAFTYTAVFDPATLNLSIFLQAGNWDSGTQIWTSTASIGNSGTHPATSSGFTNGALLNGHQTVAPNGVNQFSTSLALSNFITTTVWSTWALVNMTSEGGSNSPGTPYANTLIAGDNATFWGMYVRSGPPPQVQAFAWHGGVTVKETSFTNSTWQFLQIRSNGVTIEARVDGNAWSTGATGTIDSLAGTLVFTGSGFSGNIADVGISPVRLDDATFESIRIGYINQRYALSL